MTGPYELIYYTGVPTRREYIRLTLEEATGSLGMEKCREFVTHYFAGYYQDEQGNPPYYAPPLFKHGSPVISQSRASGKYDRVFQLWKDVKDRRSIPPYIFSYRRQKYDWDIYRDYLDNAALAEQSLLRIQICSWAGDKQ
ncbi:hypothetical protein F4775DRAFT_595822 [Biscogniauxia sp. FL1348]|nr:hypothetical protein F4775DRAFT_595822 [Biscogniauxia sp. FL1348]